MLPKSKVTADFPESIVIQSVFEPVVQNKNWNSLSPRSQQIFQGTSKAVDFGQKLMASV